MRRKRHIAAASALLFIIAAGCSETQHWQPNWSFEALNSGSSGSTTPTAASRSEAVAPRPGSTSAGRGGSAYATPAGARTIGLGYSSPITLDKQLPAEVPVGRDFEYRLIVRNTTSAVFRDVTVTDHLPANFKLTAAGPTPTSRQGNQAVWRINELGPGQARSIRVIGKATTHGSLQGCSFVTFSPYLCATTTAVQPALRLVRSAPSQATTCDAIPVRYVVTNGGTGVARGVRLVERLPVGLMTSDNQNQIVFDAGDLASGQSRAFDVQLKAAGKGAYESVATAQAAGGLQAQAKGTTAVTQPVLEIVSDAPKVLKMGRPVAYDVTVTNTGDAPAAQTVVEQQLPTGAQLVSLSAGGQVVGGKAVWNLGTLGPEQSRKLNVTVKPANAGSFQVTASARARCAQQVDATTLTAVRGIPAILLEVVDLQDPIAVGEDVTYEVRVTNQGSSHGTNIIVTCELESTMRFVSATGTTRGAPQKNRIVFAPVPSLAPKAQATWRVKVKAVEDGDVRFKTTMTSNQIKRPVEETEATNFFR